MTDELRLEYVPLTELKRWPRNPKDHDLGLLHSSIERFGFVNPIIVNDETGIILAGHGRLDALVQHKLAGGQPPKRVRVDGDDWLIPVVRGVSLPDAEAEAYAVADNRTVELGGWDEGKLAAILSDLTQDGGLQGVGFDEDDLDALLAFTSFDAFEDLPDLEWSEPDKAWRVIIQCEDKREYDDLKLRLGLGGKSEKQVRFNYSEVVWPSDITIAPDGQGK